MGNPKVFEYAKEIGMTPLALMDKIREWKLPVKSHMAELNPDMLEKIKVNLFGEEKEETKASKTKKVARKKITSTAKIARPTKASTVSASAGETTEPAPAKKTSRTKISGTSVIRRKAKAEPAIDKNEELEQEDSAEETSIEITASKVIEAEANPQSELEQVAANVAIEKIVEPVQEEVKATKPTPTVPSRKKEVVVGTSGVASSTTPVSSSPRRNIIGRMDLSRVNQIGGQGQRGERSGPGGQGGGARQGGFSSQTRTGQNRNIRTGFVSAASIEVPIVDEHAHDENYKNKELDKKAKKLSGAGGTAKERELEELQNFNAVEFRKRELVFQPKKKKEDLGREALKTKITQSAAHKRVLKVYGAMKLADVAQEMGIKAPQLIKVLMQNGVMANMNTELDFDTLALVVPEFNWEAQNIMKSAEEVASETAFGELNAELENRPPVVTVMGHVDHGKTSLLDAIRNADVASGEKGGITQHIGAYSVTIEDGTKITFLDTPGHEAFTAMRARGANATDIAIVVVAADDGVMPQTAEAINHAKAAGVPIIIAVNKMDKPGANPDKVKQQLTEFEIVPEEWGGNTIFAPVSAVKKTGIKELLENIKLVAEMQDLKANHKRSGTGIVIESKVEKGKGPVATLLVKDGNVRVGQYIVAGTHKGRVRSLINDRGERVDEATPGMPVEVLGLDNVPNAGDRFDIVIDEEAANRISKIRKEELDLENAQTGKLTLEEIFSKVQRGDVKELGIILKTDVQGSLEAIKGMIQKANTNEVKTKIIHSAVGGITESDVLLGHTSKGIIIGFNVRPDSVAQNKAKQLGIEIRTYGIVYELMDDLKKAMAGLLTPEIVEKVMGSAEVRNTFTVPKAGTIAGCFVNDGKIARSNNVRLIRDGKVIYDGKIGSLKRFKDDAKEVATGFECGIGIENYNDLKVGDVIEAYIKEEVKRELTSIEAST